MTALKINTMKRGTYGLKLCVYVCLLFLLFSGCKTQKSSIQKGFKNDIFGIANLQCQETPSPNAIDSRVASLSCEGITFSYDYGMYSYAGPLTPEEEFTRSFDTYHHKKFFENRMIDPKVYKIFLDSVQIVDVRRKKATDPLLFACDPCNAVSELTFLGDTYFYPHTLSDKQLDDEGFTVKFEDRGEYIFKFYQSPDASPGLYITPRKNRYKTKNTLSLQVIETELPAERIMSILEKVYLIEG